MGEDGTSGFWIRASDGGEAEMSADRYGILISRPHAGAVFGIAAELVSRLGAVVIDPSGAGAVCRAEERAHLPADMRDDAVVVDMTGEALDAALTGPRRP